MFLQEESGTKSGATVGGPYQIQLEKVFASVKITNSLKSLPQVGNT